ncbi:S1C family serine protease [Gandjariella thermophila]|uniref:Serine protease PepD n=1 Tax=Gandjariella thermophila TaxID=1931992 RepID=A0A4D4JEM3_9PSEU|nr:trypsin-like peptidase domain-containing protein [Gandjariella thermophila]GDY33490.1 serine protease PepD [Gandjariella thermophila]
MTENSPGAGGGHPERPQQAGEGQEPQTTSEGTGTDSGATSPWASGPGAGTPPGSAYGAASASSAAPAPSPGEPPAGAASSASSDAPQGVSSAQPAGGAPQGEHNPWQSAPYGGFPQYGAQQMPPGPPGGPTTLAMPGQPPGGPSRRGLGVRRSVAGVALLALVVGGLAGVGGGYLGYRMAEQSTAVNALDRPLPAKQTSNAPAGSVEQVAQKVLPSVVQLQVRGGTEAGEGSGIVLSSDGLILTNNHVVEVAANGGQIQAVFQDGRQAAAQVVGRDPTSDLAVVKAQNVTGLTPADLGRSDDLRVGQQVVAIGSPFDLNGTVTSGIVSALNRPVRAGGETGNQATVLDAIQTDAAINPGNSGGPLVNMQGQVIGINSAIYSPNQGGLGGQSQAGSVGIGFAIPINQARRIADELAKGGSATQTVLGVSVQDDPSGNGASVNNVTPGGAADKAGIKAGDVIIKLDDRRIPDSDALVAAVRSHNPGDTVTLTLAGGGTKQVTLGGQPVGGR